MDLIKGTETGADTKITKTQTLASTPEPITLESFVFDEHKLNIYVS